MLPDTRKLNHANVMTPIIFVLLRLGTLEQLRVKANADRLYSTVPLNGATVPTCRELFASRAHQKNTKSYALPSSRGGQN